MKHLGAILCALALIAFAGFLLVNTKPCGLTMFDRWTIVCSIALALALAIPAQFREAASTVREFLPFKATKQETP
jgi:hypothetical protein